MRHASLTSVILALVVGLPATTGAVEAKPSAQTLRERIAFITEATPAIEFAPWMPALRPPKRRNSRVRALEVGLVDLSGEGVYSLFLAGADADNMYLTLMTPGKEHSVSVYWPVSASSQPEEGWTSDKFSLAAERTFLNTVKYAYGFTNPSGFRIPEPNHFTYRLKPPFYDTTSPRRSYGESLKLAVNQIKHVRFITSVHAAHFEEPVKAFRQYRGAPTTTIDGPLMRCGGVFAVQIATLDIEGRGTPSLLLTLQFVSTRDVELRMMLITAGKPGPATAHLQWNSMDRTFPPTLVWCENCGDPLKVRGVASGSDADRREWTKFAVRNEYEPELNLLRQLIYCHGYMSPCDISELADGEPGLAWHLWQRDNGRIITGPLHIRRYPGDEPDPNDVLLTDGEVVYWQERPRGVLWAYDRRTAERYVLYQSASAWWPVRGMFKRRQWLVIGSYKEVAAIRPADCYMNRVKVSVRSVGEIQQTQAGVSVNGGEQVISWAELGMDP